jgi:hypothetical protein
MFPFSLSLTSLTAVRSGIGLSVSRSPSFFSPENMLEAVNYFGTTSRDYGQPAPRKWIYHPQMRIATLKKKIALMFIPKRDRLSHDEGYSALLQLGWPPEIITLKMCDKAKQGVMKPYAGIQSWINYKSEWEWAEGSR